MDVVADVVVVVDVNLVMNVDLDAEGIVDGVSSKLKSSRKIRR